MALSRAEMDRVLTVLGSGTPGRPAVRYTVEDLAQTAGVKAERGGDVLTFVRALAREGECTTQEPTGGQPLLVVGQPSRVARRIP